MNPWPFVIAAYAVMVLGVGVLLIGSWRRMRQAEEQANALRDPR